LEQAPHGLFIAYVRQDVAVLAFGSAGNRPVAMARDLSELAGGQAGKFLAVEDEQVKRTQIVGVLSW
tara:strand:- start:3800 stop:4000 length:201 start_codon:yes stop_codon:yes gene_type:complete